MHELGIIVHIAKTLDQVAAENELKKIGSVTLDIGEVSGIVPEYLTECWEFYRKKNPLIAECEMKIESLPAVTICEAMNAVSRRLKPADRRQRVYNNHKMDMEGKTRTVFPPMSILRLWKSDS